MRLRRGLVARGNIAGEHHSDVVSWRCCGPVAMGDQGLDGCIPVVGSSPMPCLTVSLPLACIVILPFGNATLWIKCIFRRVGIIPGESSKGLLCNGCKAVLREDHLSHSRLRSDRQPKVATT